MTSRLLIWRHFGHTPAAFGGCLGFGVFVICFPRAFTRCSNGRGNVTCAGRLISDAWRLLAKAVEEIRTGQRTVRVSLPYSHFA
ncbi:hypothetical protein EJ04DRAFT_94934 [Polyplosphaeria fusca]|uniref:Uncharacterized protein n=1 Tax=Polyplosphaeria fusca TaxID=682080 RepID=A0A9P4R2V0_9PLEO|nr:hypothetical protein EJ04DRAFT_94934 [Polyplosphaeria fusca]